MAIHGKKDGTKAARFLVSVGIVGSSGPIRFVASEGITAAVLVESALAQYAREGRRPVLGSDLKGFVLFRANAGSDALNPWDTISASGGRNFLLYKKELLHPAVPASSTTIDPPPLRRKGSGGFLKSWFSLLKISSHRHKVADDMAGSRRASAILTSSY